MNKDSPSFLDRFIKIAALFLLIFIPLYPKLPLLDITYTWVYIRLEDFIIAFVVGVYVASLVRKRRLPGDNPLFLPILFYWFIGFSSTLISIVFIGKTIPDYFPHLVVLHFLRRIEYMVVFFIAASSVRSVKDIYHYSAVFGVTAFLVSAYGYGQKYMQFPAFLTMNEEFAKGEPLILSTTSRIASTFAGQYDLAAYLVFAIALFASLFFGVRNIFAKISFVCISIACSIVLLWTQSRNSLAALSIALFCVIWWHKKRVLFIPILIVLIFLLPVLIRSSDRFTKTFRWRQVLYDSRAGVPVGAARVNGNGIVTIEESASPALENLPIGSGFIRIPRSAPVPVIASYAVKALRSRDDYPQGLDIPNIGEEGQMALETGQLHFSLFYPIATTTGEIESIRNRFFIDQALTYDISLTTRFQGTWPRAWEAFSRNIFLGSGYSVLNLASDSDYLRALGETGAFGFASFFFIFIAFYFFVRRAIRSASPFVVSMTLGVGAAIVSLLIGALFVDIFEASKVAYILWMSVGISIGGLLLTYKKPFPIWQEVRAVLAHPFFFIGVIAIAGFVLFGSAAKIYFVADDFTWLRWATTSYISDVPKFFTDASGFFYRPLSKLYFLSAFSLFWFKPEGYHFVNIVLHIVATVFVYLIARETTKRFIIAIGASLFFLIMAIHHENVLWISGVSSLAGGVSAFASVYLFLRFVHAVKWQRWFSLLLSFTFMAISLVWYEGMLGMPLVIAACAFLFGVRRDRWWGMVFVLLIPSYWFLRTWANAVPPAGNYGIHLSALPFNVVGNSLGYIGMSLFGPYTAIFFGQLRAGVRTNLPSSIVIATVMAGVLLHYWRRSNVHIRINRSTFFWMSVFLFSLVPYLGLGNTSERYGYVASSAIAVLFVMGVLHLYTRLRIIAVLVALSVLWINWDVLHRQMGDWERAGIMTQNILSTVRKSYFPLTSKTTFIFVDVPLRLERAWVFPVGLNDALYQVFHDDRLQVETVSTPTEGIRRAGQIPSGATHVFVIENDNAKEIY